MDDEFYSPPWFESSEILAAFLASSSIPVHSWELCSQANAAAPRSFVVKQFGNTGYISFSGIQEMPASVLGSAKLVPLAAASSEMFPSFNIQGGGGAALREEGEEEVPAMVHAGMLHLFLYFMRTTDLEGKIKLLIQCKSIVITGYSIGATTASLTALWLLSRVKSNFNPPQIFCVTFGSPLLGNKSLSDAIITERWGGNFCHFVSNHDIVPRLLFTPLDPFTHHLQCLLQFWHSSMASQLSQLPALTLTEDDVNGYYRSIFSGVERAATADEGSRSGMEVWPFGSYVFCSTEGAICIDNANCVVKMLHLMLMSGSPDRSIKDHLLYGAYASKLCDQLLTRRNFTESGLPESSYEASVSLALQSSAIYGQDPLSTLATDCLLAARREDLMRNININSAKLAIGLSRINPLRAQIEWYMASCSRSPDKQGYYDSFKKRGYSKRETQINMNIIKLRNFWGGMIQMWERGELPHDFHQRAKWVNGAHSYQLQVEPLEIAKYYRKNLHRTQGHYITHGRKRMFEVFDRWWKKNGGQKEGPRTTFASLTQDPCFWARVEEAWDWLEQLSNEPTNSQVPYLLEKIRSFESYAENLIVKKEVSEDVIATNSTYSLWIKRWRELQNTFPLLSNGQSA
ncbi:hypothetical protein SAY87_006486 [Trapa incisa]|uniref:Lipase-like PAD4 n=1 Tax=Trapa incisa TaxID=236973 RepID=A0AAN7K132_9MYRT|nr:hypothetical protein SAY87_006486 [Trapa incisa]